MASVASKQHESFFSRTLEDADPEIFGASRSELGRQRHEIELIASENIVSRAVLIGMEAAVSEMLTAMASWGPVRAGTG